MMKDVLQTRMEAIHQAVALALQTLPAGSTVRTSGAGLSCVIAGDSACRAGGQVPACSDKPGTYDAQISPSKEVVFNRGVDQGARLLKRMHRV